MVIQTVKSFRFKKYLEGSKEELFDMGFPKFTTEDFHDMVSFCFIPLYDMQWDNKRG